MQSEHIMNSGNPTANGGYGTATGEFGGNITATSNTISTANTGTPSATAYAIWFSGNDCHRLEFSGRAN